MPPAPCQKWLKKAGKTTKSVNVCTQCIFSNNLKDEPWLKENVISFTYRGCIK